MERHLDVELRHLQERLLTMASLVEGSIGRAIHALVSREAPLAQQVVHSDEPINMAEIDIDELCLKMTALYHPEATDLRFIMMAFKINNDLERIGDLAVNIAERTLELLKEPLLKPLIDIPRMATVAAPFRPLERSSTDGTYSSRSAAVAGLRSSVSALSRRALDCSQRFARFSTSSLSISGPPLLCSPGRP